MRAIKYRNSGIEAYNQDGVVGMEMPDRPAEPTFVLPAKPVRRRYYPTPGLRADLRPGTGRRPSFKINA